MKRTLFFFTIVAPLFAQTAPRQVAHYLESALQTPDVAAYQLRQYLDRKSIPLPTPSSHSTMDRGIPTHSPPRPR